MGMFKDLKQGLQAAGAGMEQVQALQQQAAAGGAHTGVVPGTATVDGVADTGMVVNGSPVLELGLTVSVPGRAPYAVKHRQVVPPVDRARFQPGSMLSGRVSTHDPNQVMLG